MTITALGELPLGTLNPGAATAVVSVNASVNASLANLQAQLAGTLAAQVSLLANPPNIAAQLAQAIALVQQLTLILASGIPAAPDVQITAVATVIADLTASVAELQGSLAFAATLGGALGASAAAYTYQGPCRSFGAELHSYVGNGLQGGGPATECSAFVVATTDPATKAAMDLVYI